VEQAKSALIWVASRGCWLLGSVAVQVGTWCADLGRLALRLAQHIDSTLDAGQ